MKSDYTKFSRITFTRGLGITLGAIASVFLLRALTRGHLADTIVRQITQRFLMSEAQADIVYFRVVTANMQSILDTIITLFVFLLFHMLLHSYRRYFDEALLGVDKLMEDGGRISLSPELETAECKLNYTKQTPKARADEAKEMEQQKNDPMVYLTHDIRTPLTSMIEYFSLLDENPDMTDDRKARYVHTAWEKANRLRILANEFLEITCSCSESTTFHKAKVDLHCVLTQISEELYPQLSTYEKHIENNVDKNMPVCGDSEKLARVSNNIPKNAVSYNEDSSVILISTKESPEKTVIRFENKENILSDKLDLVSNKFHYLNNVRQSDTGGSGLRPAIAKDIITPHGGRIQTESNGGYTAFIIEIPSAVCKDLGMTS